MGFKCQCSYCGQKLEAEDSWEGQKCACPNCNQEIVLSKPKPPPMNNASQIRPPKPTPINNTSQNNQKKTSLPETAKILGIVSIFTLGITAIPAIICGHLGLQKLNHGYSGKKKDAFIGLVIGYILIVLVVIGSVDQAIDAYTWKNKRQSTINSIEQALENGDFKSALNISRPYKYRYHEDQTLQQLISKAERLKKEYKEKIRKEREVRRKEQEISKIISKIKSSSSSIRETYIKDLMKADPNNKEFKMEFLAIKEKQEAEKRRPKVSHFDPKLLDIEAWTITKEFVKKRLKSPSTAKFEWCDTDKVKYIGNKRFRVTAYVDAKNSFNATIRMFYTCVVEKDGKDWVLISLDMR